MNVEHFKFLMNISGFDVNCDEPQTVNDYYLIMETAKFLMLRNIMNKERQSEMAKCLDSINCLEIFKFAQKCDLKHLMVLARYIALTEFNKAKNTSGFFNLSRTEVYTYLSDAYLWVDNEMDVFDASMKWLRYNNHIEDTEGTLFLLLSCINFNELSVSDINEIIKHNIVKKYSYVVDVLNFLLGKQKKSKSKNYIKNVGIKAMQLKCSKSRSRDCVAGFLCRKDQNCPEDVHIYWYADQLI